MNTIEQDYKSPTTELINLRIESGILTVSGSGSTETGDIINSVDWDD